MTTALLLIGHGAFDVVMHKDWTGSAVIGISSGTLAAHPLTPLAGWSALADGRVGQSDRGEGRKAGRHIHVHPYSGGLDAAERGGPDLGEHGPSLG